MELGIGIGWRPEIADAIERLPGVDWVEAVAENLCPGHLPESLVRLRRRGVTVVPHGVSLGLGGADRPDAGRLADLAARAEALSAPLVTEHIAFVRAGGALTASPRLEAGHLLPVPRTWDALEVLCENVRIAQDSLPVPLALENIAALVNWPDEDMTEGQFLAELVERTGVRLLIDVANLHTNRVNRGEDPAKALSELPVEAIAYVHVAGGVEKDGVWHDTHAHPVGAEVLGVLAELVSRVSPRGVLLERDDAFPPEAELAGELGAIRRVLAGDSPTPPLPETLRGWVGVEVALPGATPPDPVAGPAAPAPRSGLRPGPRTGHLPSVVGRRSAGTTDHRPAGEQGPGAQPRLRLAVAQTALLSALVAGTPVPHGFDPTRLRVQARALAAKRADVVAKVAPELPRILGDAYRPAYLAYARSRPMRDGYRRDALDFVESLLKKDLDGNVARQLGRWWKERAGTRPQGRAARFLKGLVRAA
ncbi:DUF692 domain-containing protein [Streptomyces sp. BPTC-684]|uniref:DUF692 domain-containing protein n=1 Tax=Streptomyces sp. BPTC-684 TaxID=3043734 RepID=UPI0024B06BEB|nr:DUF692 domain-containing protein [Streptomyces sp. BPTC-684]WHM35933.1 DUF692 domain-containing protein [Streptomyces sp. BPTC-684]